MSAAFEALDVSSFMPKEDTPEVTALKKRVREVASKYTAQHGWCDEVDEALREMGVNEDHLMLVDVDLGPLGVVPVAVSPSELHGKTATQQAKVLAEKIGDLRFYVAGARTDVKAADAVQWVRSISMHDNDSALPSTRPDSRWMVLPTGKTAHLMVDWTRRLPENTYVYTVCGNYGDYPRELKEPTASTRKCKTCTKDDVA